MCYSYPIKNASRRTKPPNEEHNEKITKSENYANMDGHGLIVNSLEELVDSFDNMDNLLVNIDSSTHSLITNHEIGLEIDEIIEKKEGRWKCKVCAKPSALKRNIQSHAEIHIEGVTYACRICSKTFSMRDSLRTHISSIHSESFPCDICEKTGMNRKAYNDHKRRKHKSVSIKQ